MANKATVKRLVLAVMLAVMAVTTVTVAPSAHADGCTQPPATCGG